MYTYSSVQKFFGKNKFFTASIGSETKEIVINILVINKINGEKIVRKLIFIYLQNFKTFVNIYFHTFLMVLEIIMLKNNFVIIFS